MLKIKRLIIAVCLSLSCFSTTLLAEEESLAYKALNGGKMVESPENLVDLANELGDFNVVTYEIIDEVPSLTRSSEQEIKKTVVTYFVDSAKVQRAGTGKSEYNEDILDHSFNVYSTFYYTRSYDDGVTYVLLTKAEGGITRKDNAWTIYSQTVTIGCNGISVGTTVRNQKKSYSIGASASYSYNTPSSWLPVSTNDEYHVIGILYEWEIGRINGAKYSGAVQNYY